MLAQAYVVLGPGCTLYIKLSFQLFSVMFSQIDVAVLLFFGSYALFEDLLPDLLLSSLENRVHD